MHSIDAKIFQIYRIIVVNINTIYILLESVGIQIEGQITRECEKTTSKCFLNYRNYKYILENNIKQSREAFSKWREKMNYYFTFINISINVFHG